MSSSPPPSKRPRHEETQRGLLSSVVSIGDRFADVTIKAGGQEFKVHRLILSSRSSKFETMITSAAINSSSSPTVLDLPGHEPAAVQAMLDYFYHENYKYSSEAGDSMLTFHTKMFATANIFGNKPLADEAYNEFGSVCEFVLDFGAGVMKEGKKKSSAKSAECADQEDDGNPHGEEYQESNDQDEYVKRNVKEHHNNMMAAKMVVEAIKALEILTPGAYLSKIRADLVILAANGCWNRGWLELPDIKGLFKEHPHWSTDILAECIKQAKSEEEGEEFRRYGFRMFGRVMEELDAGRDVRQFSAALEKEVRDSLR